MAQARERATGGRARRYLLPVAVTVLWGCASGIAPVRSPERELHALEAHLERVELLASAGPGSVDRVELERRVREAKEIVDRQPVERSRRSMASRLLRSLYEAGPSFRSSAGMLPVGYVPVLGTDCDAGEGARIDAVPIGAFTTDGAGCPIGLRGPRVFVALASGREALEPRPDGQGGFTDAANPMSAGMGTAFVVGSATIEEAERWVGRHIPWGSEGRLRLVTRASTDRRLECLYDTVLREVRLGLMGAPSSDGESLDIVVDASCSRDAVAHECGHAVVAALKPGFVSGIGVCLSEALADMTACLLAFGDPATCSRVLSRTGGDLRLENEASSICEALGRALAAGAGPPRTCLRSVANQTGLRALDLSPDTVGLPGPAIDAVVGLDAHDVSQAVSGALYETLVGVYEQERRQGADAGEAIELARDVTGTLMLRSLDYVGEHGPSLRDYAVALVRVEGELYRGRYRRALCTALYRRNFLDPFCDLDRELEANLRWLRGFEFAPGSGEEELASRFCELESLPDPVRSLPPGVAYARLCAMAMVPRVSRLIRLSRARGEKWLESDTTSRDGTRVVRMRFALDEPGAAAVSRPPPIGGVGAGPAATQPARGSSPPRYASLVFDAHGHLVALHLDEPVLE